jgi:Major capsid protein N-terminus
MIYSLAKVKVNSARDKHYSDWLYIWNELTLPESKVAGYNLLVGSDVVESKATTLYIPLEFWFCRNVGLALPLIALIARAEKHHPHERKWAPWEKRFMGSHIYIPRC